MESRSCTTKVANLCHTLLLYTTIHLWPSNHSNFLVLTGSIVLTRYSFYKVTSFACEPPTQHPTSSFKVEIDTCPLWATKNKNGHLPFAHPHDIAALHTPPHAAECTPKVAKLFPLILSPTWKDLRPKSPEIRTD